MCRLFKVFLFLYEKEKTSEVSEKYGGVGVGVCRKNREDVNIFGKKDLLGFFFCYKFVINSFIFWLLNEMGLIKFE